jgi:hypothetical protein
MRNPTKTTPSSRTTTEMDREDKSACSSTNCTKRVAGEAATTWKIGSKPKPRSMPRPKESQRKIANKERWAQIGIATDFLIVVRTPGEFFRLRYVLGTNFSTAVATPLCRRRFDSCLLLLCGRDLLLLPTLYAVRLDRASDCTRSAGVQNRRDRLVVAAAPY